MFLRPPCIHPALRTTRRYTHNHPAHKAHTICQPPPAGPSISTAHPISPPPTPTMTDYPSLSTSLLHTARLAKPPSRPTSKSSTPAIAALQLHPALEAALHILNADLPPAHFLVRHMQAPPALEGMLLHGILHRCEGDFRNARLWIGDVGDAGAGFVPKGRGEGARLGGDVAERCGCAGKVEGLVEFVYGDEGVEGARRLVDDVEAFRKRKGGGEEERALDERIVREMGRVVEWCGEKFGTGRYVDARCAWVKNSEEVQKISNDMVSGGKGYREF